MHDEIARLVGLKLGSSVRIYSQILKSPSVGEV